MGEWYPQEKDELNKNLEKFLISSKYVEEEVHGLVVPHAGYVYSGEIAGRAFALLKNYQKEKIIVVGPSHREWFRGVRVMDKVETPLGKIKVICNDFDKTGYEHSVDNQIPFLQRLGFREVLPLVVGELNIDEAKDVAQKILKIRGIYVFSTDLSHFLDYDEAVRRDKKSIEIIENLDFSRFLEIDACGRNGLGIMMYLCKVKGLKPRLIEYKNSGDVVGNKSQVVGYGSFWF